MADDKTLNEILVGDPVEAESPLKIDGAIDVTAWYIYHSVSRIRRAYTRGSDLDYAELDIADDDLKVAVSHLEQCDPDRVEPLPEYLRRVAEILIARLERARCPGCGHFGCEGDCILPDWRELK